MQRSIPVLYEKETFCCGCTACFAICPREAITMAEDDEGFEYPVVDEVKCVRCYLCLRACPIKNKNGGALL